MLETDGARISKTSLSPGWTLSPLSPQRLCPGQGFLAHVGAAMCMNPRDAACLLKGKFISHLFDASLGVGEASEESGVQVVSLKYI